jgi:hypothetical protein
MMGALALLASPLTRYQLVVDGEYYSGHRLRQVTREVRHAPLSNYPFFVIAKHMSKRVLRRLKLSSGPINE